ncbi:hypothetical protein [Spirillospora sp. NPDC048824]|uniref:hypothetical protein n=1 Tax=Spirillospora sp. NPDC048824 TaxID=3364526 RepID=UPI003714B904
MIDWSAVEIGDEHEIALRAYLVDGPETWLSLQNELVVPQTAAGYTQVIQTAFGIAVTRRFSPTYNIHQIIRYVADVRLQLQGPGQAFNPRVAENLIRRYLADPSLPEETEPVEVKDAEQESLALITLLYLLVNDEERDEGWLNEFVREAGNAARQWLSAHQATAAN